MLFQCITQVTNCYENSIQRPHSCLLSADQSGGRGQRENKETVQTNGCCRAQWTIWSRMMENNHSLKGEVDKSAKACLQSG